MNQTGSLWRWHVVYVVIAGMILLFGADARSDGSQDKDVAAAFHPFANLLERHLIEKTLENNGLVSAFNYQAAREDPASNRLLEEQTRRLNAFDTSRLNTREKAIAFWNNAYNFFMIRQILKEPVNGRVVDSVWDYGGRYNPFRSNIFERDLFVVDGKSYSLDDMEKGILLGDAFREKGWKEARVHFTVNCAAVGCPPLRKAIYTADNIETQMTENTRRAFNTPRHLRLDGTTLYVTELFKWYEADFVEENGSIQAFIRAYADDAVIEKVNAASQIRYIDYDWSLNRPENFPEF